MIRANPSKKKLQSGWKFQPSPRKRKITISLGVVPLLKFGMRAWTPCFHKNYGQKTLKQKELNTTKWAPLDLVGLYEINEWILLDPYYLNNTFWKWTNLRIGSNKSHSPKLAEIFRLGDFSTAFLFSEPTTFRVTTYIGMNNFVSVSTHCDQMSDARCAIEKVLSYDGNSSWDNVGRSVCLFQNSGVCIQSNLKKWKK